MADSRVLVLRERERLLEKSQREHRFEDRVVVERHGPVLSICLDRPRKMNAFDKDMFVGLARALAMLEDDATLRIGVLHANGIAFTSGLDIVSAAPLAARGELRLDTGLVDLVEFQPDTRRRTKPLIAAVHGKCINFGVEIAAACDVVLAAEGTVFGQKEVTVGLFPFGGATVNLAPKIGLGNALRYMLTADDFSVQEAHRMGLVQEIVPAESLLEFSLAMAQRVAANSPLGVLATLSSVRTAREKGKSAALAQLPAEIVRMTSSSDFREGLLSFQEKRAPSFTGD
jgi:enoyl-CoA hydratase/carnithine racemase